MGFKSFLAKPVARYLASEIKYARQNPLKCQEKIFKNLLENGRKTAYGKKHAFDEVKNYADYQAKVPIVDYEYLKPYIEKIAKGENDVLWTGKPIYFAKTSGTTSGAKYIPITKASIPNHINTARAMLVMYIDQTGKTDFVDGKMMFMSGSPVMEKYGGIPTGRLSGIVHHHVPKYLLSNRLPTFETNCIENWEEKMEKTADETIGANMTLISGIPPWVQSYFDVVTKRTGKKLSEVFPNFSLFAHGGVNYAPYREAIENSIGKKIDTLESYPASEGFIAFQDNVHEENLLLNVNSGIFFEFIPLENVHDENPPRYRLEEVETDKNYAVIINSNAGLWGYNIGDTVKFVSKNPYKLVVTGRVKHFISAFGEHVIAEEVENAMQEVLISCGGAVHEFTVAPRIEYQHEKPCHEWFVEFSEMPEDKQTYLRNLDEKMRSKNVYYDDLRRSNILGPLKIFSVRENAFTDYMKSIGKYGGQNKLPRLSNNRNITEKLEQFIVEKWEMIPPVNS